MKLIKKLAQSKTMHGIFIVFALWYCLNITLNSNVVPAPYETTVTLIKLLKGELLIHIAVSLFRIIAAMLISIILGVPLGLWIGLNKYADSTLSPAVYILYPIPKIAFLPVFMILFGLGDTSKIILMITIIIFPILLAARDGVKEISTELIYSVKTLGLNRWQIYINLVLPAVLPKIISSLRISIGISISVLFFGENYATTYGMGYFIMNSWAIVNYKEMFAGILALSLLGLIIFRFIDFLEERFCPWVFINKQ